MPPHTTAEFFDTFFRLPVELQRAMTSGRTDLAGTVAAMAELFRKAPRRHERKAANWAEVLQKIRTNGDDSDRQSVLLTALGPTVKPLTAEDARTAADLHATTRRAGLSLGDRFCLALAVRLGTPALTADKAWAGLDLPVGVELIH